MSRQSITAVIIGVTVLFLVIYDIVALYTMGVKSTISVVLNSWFYFGNPALVFGLGMIFGGLLVHFIGWKPNNNDRISDSDS